ncbi:serine/arginine repetitive matrix protein 2, partial [Streptomyces boncukensis]
MQSYGHIPNGGPPPPPPRIPAKDLRPRRVWYVVAAVLALVLAGAGATVLGLTMKKSVDAIDTDRSFPGGGSRTVSLTSGETKAIYVSQSGKGRVDCRIPGLPSGSMTHPDSDFVVSSGSRTWERVFEVKPGSSGEYTLSCTSERKATFALGDKPEVGATVAGVVAGIGLLLAALAAVVTISIVTAVRRGRDRTRRTAVWAPPSPWSAPPQW